MDKTVKVWFDAEADFLEVVFHDAPALMARRGGLGAICYRLFRLPVPQLDDCEDRLKAELRALARTA